MSSAFELLLFSTDPVFIQKAVAGGVAGIVVDWEVAGKAKHQWGFDTEINADTLKDLQRVRAATDARVICRVNAYHPGTPAKWRTPSGVGRTRCSFPWCAPPPRWSGSLTGWRVGPESGSWWRPVQR